jgi:hypothetical protein
MARRAPINSMTDTVLFAREALVSARTPHVRPRWNRVDHHQLSLVATMRDRCASLVAAMQTLTASVFATRLSVSTVSSKPGAALWENQGTRRELLAQVWTPFLKSVLSELYTFGFVLCVVDEDSQNPRILSPIEADVYVKTERGMNTYRVFPRRDHAPEEPPLADVVVFESVEAQPNGDGTLRSIILSLVHELAHHNAIMHSAAAAWASAAAPTVLLEQVESAPPPEEDTRDVGRLGGFSMMNRLSATDSARSGAANAMGVAARVAALQNNPWGGLPVSMPRVSFDGTRHVLDSTDRYNQLPRYETGAAAEAIASGATTQLVELKSGFHVAHRVDARAPAELVAFAQHIGAITAGVLGVPDFTLQGSSNTSVSDAIMQRFNFTIRSAKTIVLAIADVMLNIVFTDDGIIRAVRDYDQTRSREENFVGARLVASLPSVLSIEVVERLAALGVLSHDQKCEHVALFLGVPRSSLAAEPINPELGQTQAHVDAREERMAREDRAAKAAGPPPAKKRKKK